MKKLLGIVVLGLLWCNVGFADDQADRKKLIDNLINKHNIFEKIEIPGTIPRVWVTPKFHLQLLVFLLQENTPLKTFEFVFVDEPTGNTFPKHLDVFVVFAF